MPLEAGGMQCDWECPFAFTVGDATEADIEEGSSWCNTAVLRSSMVELDNGNCVAALCGPGRLRMGSVVMNSKSLSAAAGGADSISTDDAECETAK